MKDRVEARNRFDSRFRTSAGQRASVIGGRMIASGRLTCFWPGLAAAWHRGNTTSAAIAVGSMWALSVLLLATFVWPQWMSVWMFRCFWLLASVVWFVAAVRSQFQFKRMMLVAKPLEAKDNFLQAQVDYLAGNWFEAEAKLLQILHEFPRDAESQLMLVGVLRRTKRFRPGLRRLAHLETLDSAARWRHEIRRERELIELRMAEELETSSSETNSEADSNAVSERGEDAARALPNELIAGEATDAGVAAADTVESKARTAAVSAG